jgi:biotin carboxyl carrier protein
MKMEFHITAEVDGVVKSVLVKEGQQLSAGQMMLTIEFEP